LEVFPVHSGSSRRSTGRSGNQATRLQEFG
jgi:hypothetical protein